MLFHLFHLFHIGVKAYLNRYFGRLRGIYEGNKWNEGIEKWNQLYRVKILKFVPFVPFSFHLVPLKKDAPDLIQSAFCLESLNHFIIESFLILVELVLMFA